MESSARSSFWRRHRRAIIWSSAAGALLVGCGLLGWGLTAPRFATPFARFALRASFGSSAQVEKAWVSYGGLTAHLRGVSIPSRLSAGSLDIGLAPFAWMAGGRAVSRLALVDGEVSLSGDGPADAKPSNPLASIAALDISGLELHYGKANAHKFTVDSATGSLVKGTLDLKGHGPRTKIAFQGSADLTTRRHLGGQVTIEGQNIAEAADLLGLAAPDTPPFHIEGTLALESGVWSLSAMNGKVGNSDLEGRVDVHPQRGRPHIQAALRSRRLDFEDIGILVGAPSGSKTGEVNAEQRVTNASYAAATRLIPDAHLDFSRLGRVDADIDFRADSVTTGVIPMTGVTTHFTLQDRVLTFDPLIFETTRGSLKANIVIDARSDPAASTIKGQISGLGLDQFVAGKLARGKVNADLNLKLTGSDFRTAAAHSSGAIVLWGRDLEIRQLAVEGAGLEAGKAIVTILSETVSNPKMESVRCLAVRLALKEGNGTLEPGVIDAKHSLVIASGGIDFGNEGMHIALNADTKGFSWGRFKGNASIKGTLRHPDVGAKLQKTVSQSAIAGLLSALAAPLAALPFFDLGDGEDVPCADVLARALHGGQSGRTPAPPPQTAGKK